MSRVALAFLKGDVGFRYPLGSHSWIGQAAEHIQGCVPIASVRRSLLGGLGLEFGNMPWEFRVRQSRMQMMNAMERLVKK
jgi:hypothetical protein